MGGFVCNGCSIFQQYNFEKDAPIGFSFLVPDDWNVINQKVVNGWITNKKTIIYCKECSRSLKINKIRHEILKNEEKQDC